MNTYVMSDIHGCYDEFMKMLKLIEFCEEDQLIIAGDYIDRGTKNYEMLKWIESAPDNVLLLCGNHDRDFAINIDFMKQACESNGLNVNMESNETAQLIYQLTKELLEVQSAELRRAFDSYGTIQSLIKDAGATLSDFMRWSSRIAEMPLSYKLKVNQRKCVIVHAGYIEQLDGMQMKQSYDSVEEFYLYAREDAYICGGMEHGMVIAGHTPTLIPREMVYNNGNVYQCYDQKKDCIFYDIDCGCAYRNDQIKGKLACIRLEGEEIFYVD